MSKSEVLSELKTLISNALKEKGWGRKRLADEVQKAGGGNVHEVFIGQKFQGELPRLRQGGFKPAGEDSRYLKIGEVLGIRDKLIPLAEALQYKPPEPVSRTLVPVTALLHRLNVVRLDDGLISVTLILDETCLVNRVSVTFNGIKISITRED